MNNQDPHLGEIADQLKRLRPAASTIDAQEMFFNAGYNACEAEAARSVPRQLRIAPLIAAMLLAVIVTAPASYRVGRTAGLRAQPSGTETIAVVEPPRTDSESPAPDPTPATPAAEKPAVQSQPKVQLLARWIDSYRAFTESAKLDQERRTTLAAFHSSLIGDSEPEAIGFPIADSRPSYGDWAINGVQDQPVIDSPLAANDLSQLVQSFEAGSGY